MDMNIPAAVVEVEAKAFAITRAGTFETIPLSMYDAYEADGHDVFTDYMKAVLYFDKAKRFDLAQSAKHFAKAAA